MKLIQAYSRSASVDIKHKPYLFQKFYPLGDITKYITIQNSSGMPAKNYSWYQEVLDIMLPILNKNKIIVIQLGEKSAPQLNGVLDLRGMTNIGQSAYIIKNSLLHLGNDSWLGHYSCSVETPTILLFGSTTIENHSPYHYNSEKTIFIESHRNGNKATLSREENPKTIDLILPEEIIKSILKLLNLSFIYPYKTLYMGNSYSTKCIESACTDVIDVRQIGIGALIMRLDYKNFDLKVLISQLNICKCSIVTEQEIPDYILKQYQANIIEIIYSIKQNNNPDFIKKLIEFKIPFRLISDLSDNELSLVKLNYMDFGIIIKKDISQPLDIKDNYYYKSSKITLSNGKIYQSKYDYLNSRPISSILSEPQKIIKNNLNELFAEKDFITIIEKIDM